MAGTQVTVLTADQFAARIARSFPTGWSSPQAKQPGGNLYSLMKSLSAELSAIESSLAYALGSERIGTAVAPELDLAAQDFFGSAFPRIGGETDSAYSARILAALFPTGATRAAVSAAVQSVTGKVPRIIEPWRPMDTGVLGGQAGKGMVFWNIDTVVTPFRWTNPGLRYQGFIETVLPQPIIFGPNAPPCFNVQPGGPGFWGWYWTIAGTSWINPPNAGLLGANPVYTAINRTKVFGTIVWVKGLGLVQSVLVSDSGLVLTTDTGAILTTP